MANPYTDAVMQLDANGNVVGSPLPFVATKEIVFAGGTTNAIGDYDGTGDPFTIFNTTGDVMCFIIGICTESLVGGATLEAGVVGNTAILLAQIADATGLDVNMAWFDATPALGKPFTPVYHFISGGLAIKGWIGTANITDGTIKFYCFYRPVSQDGNVVAA